MPPETSGWLRRSPLSSRSGGHTAKAPTSGTVWIDRADQFCSLAWIEMAKLRQEQCLLPSRLAKSPYVSTRQYARIVHSSDPAYAIRRLAETHKRRKMEMNIGTSKIRHASSNRINPRLIVLPLASIKPSY